ncbi:unnamed protein product [Fusarium langsethiae]|nr:unnamed protein product [Fusarium langsethiae]
MAHQDAFRQFQEIQSVVAHYEATFASITSPQVVYEEEQARLRQQIRDAIGSLRTAQSDEETANHEDAIIDLSGQMKDLERHYAANSAQYAREHEARVRETMETFRSRVGQILGLTRPTQIQTSNSQEARDQGPPDQDPPDTETQEDENEAAGGESAQGSSHSSQNAGTGTGTTANESVRRDAPNNEAIEATPDQEDAIDQGPMFHDEDDDHVDNNETNGDAVNGDESADVEMADARHAEIEPTSRRKELAEKTTVNITPASRNLRTAPLSPASTCDDGITPREGTGYQRLSQGVINTPSRNGPPSTTKEALSKKRKASTPVSTTDKRHRTEPPSLTESSLRSTGEQSRQPTAGKSRRSTREHSAKSSIPVAAEPHEGMVLRRSHRHTEESTDSDKFEGILHPKPGNIYATYWKKTKEWLAVVLLPMGDFSTVGIPGSIVSCDLIESLPPCYNKTPKKGRYVWANGYRNPRAARKGAAIMWIGARDLRPFDVKHQHRLVPHIKTIRGYLKSRDWSEDEEDSEEDSEEEVEQEMEQDAGEASEEDGREPTREEQTREDSERQQDPRPEPPQQRDAENAEEHHETLPAEEDTGILDHVTEEEECPNMKPHSHEKHANQNNIEKHASAGELAEPSSLNRHETSNTEIQRPETQPESQMEEPTSQVNDLPQHQTRYLARGNVSSSFWPTVSVAQPRLRSVAPRLHHDQVRAHHHTSLSNLPSGYSLQRPRSAAASTQPEPPNLPLPPREDPPSEEVDRKPCLRGDTIIILDSVSEDGNGLVETQDRAALETARGTSSNPPNVNRMYNQHAHRRDNQRFDDGIPQAPTPNESSNTEYSRSGPVMAGYNHTTVHEIEPRREARDAHSNYINRRNAYMQSHFGSQLPVSQAPASQDSHLPTPDTNVATSTQGQPKFFDQAQGHSSAFHHHSHSGRGNDQTALTAQPQSSQPSSGQRLTPHQYTLIPPIQSQAAHRIDQGHFQNTQPQETRPHQERSDPFQKDHNAQSSHSLFHLRPVPHTHPQPYYQPSQDMYDANIVQHSATSESGSRAAMEAIPPQQPPQGPAPLPAQNHRPYAVPVSQSSGYTRPEQTRPRPDAPTAHQPHHPPQPQGPRTISAGTDSWAESMHHYQNISQPPRTGNESSQGQRQSLPDTQPAQPATLPTYHTHSMPVATVDSQQDHNSFDVDNSPVIIKKEVDAQDEEIYAQRGHLHPGHPCFHLLLHNTGEALAHDQFYDGTNFPNGLQRYLQNYMSMNGLSPGRSGFGFQTPDVSYCELE